MNKPKSFRTEVNVEKVRPLIDYNTPVLSVGSCFAFELYKKITLGGFKSMHPGGVIYNPISLKTHLNNAVMGHTYNDKAGSYLNLLRWVSPRTIKEALVPVKDYRYPFLG